MKIFIIGITKTGKTTISNFIKDNFKTFDFGIYEVGSWARALVKDYNDESQENRSLISKLAFNKLQTNIRHSIESYEAFTNTDHYKGHNNWIVSGVRNPFDFANMFYNEDKLIILDNDTKPHDILDNGVSVIKKLCDFMNIEYLTIKNSTSVSLDYYLKEKINNYIKKEKV